MGEFLEMGGYAAYVWSAYGLGTVVLVGVLVQSIVWQRRVRRQLRERDFT